MFLEYNTLEGAKKPMDCRKSPLSILFILLLNPNTPSMMLFFCKCEYILSHLKTGYFQKKKKKAKKGCLGSCKTDCDNEQDQKDQVHQETWETRRGPIRNTTINTERAKDFSDRNVFQYLFLIFLGFFPTHPERT